MGRDLLSREIWDRDARETLKRAVLVHAEILEEIERQVRPGSLVLEIGAQRGVDAAVLADRGYRVVTLDYSDEAIAMMKAHYLGKLLIVKGDIRTLPFRGSTFDLVYSQGLIEHFFEPDLGRIMLEQKRVISPTGYVLVDVPNLFSPLTIPKHILMALGKYVLPQEWQYSWRGLRRIGRRYDLHYVRHYAWGYDRLIGRPVMRFLGSLPLGLGKVLTAVRTACERALGDYFLKCVGVFFSKQ